MQQSWSLTKKVIRIYAIKLSGLLVNRRGVILLWANQTIRVGVDHVNYSSGKILWVCAQATDCEKRYLRFRFLAHIGTFPKFPILIDLFFCSV